MNQARGRSRLPAFSIIYGLENTHLLLILDCRRGKGPSLLGFYLETIFPFYANPAY